MLNFGLSLGRPSLATPPIIQGDYIWYSVDPVNGWLVDADGNNYVVDNGNTIQPVPQDSHHGEVHATNMVWLPGDGSAYTDLPQSYNLGADDKKLADSVDAGWTDNGDNTYTGSTVTGNINGLSNLTRGTVQVIIVLSGVTEGDVNGYTADGTYTFEETLSASLSLVGTGFSGTVEVVSVKEITLPNNSYISYLDEKAQEIELQSKRKIRFIQMTKHEYILFGRYI